MISVTQGNPVSLRIQLKKGGVVFDLSDSSDISVTIVGAKVSKRLDDPVVVDGSIKVTVPATMGTGFYGIEIKGTRFNKPWRTKYVSVLELTDITTLSNNGKVKYIGEGDYFDIVMTVDLFDSGSSADLLEELERLRGEVTSLTGELAEKDEVVSQKDAVIAQKDEVISGKEEVISGLEGDLQESQQQLSDMTDERDKAALFIGSYLGGGADIEVPGRGELNIRYGTLEVPAGFTEIGDSVFRGITFIDSIDFGDVENIGNYACYECTNLKTVEGRNVQRISSSAFYGCLSLKNVSLPNLNEADPSLFYNCRSLEVISLPELTVATQYMFYGNTKLKSVDLPKVISVYSYAFYGCSALEELALPAVVSISAPIFNDACISLRRLDFAVVSSITQPINIDSIETIILRRPSRATLSNASFINNTCTVYVPDELVDEYKAATNWKNHAGQIRGLSEYVE